MAAGFAVGRPETKESRRSVSVPKPIMAMLVEYLAEETLPGREGYPVVRTLGKEPVDPRGSGRMTRAPKPLSSWNGWSTSGTRRSRAGARRTDSLTGSLT
jgi:hypothetical protein